LIKQSESLKVTPEDTKLSIKLLITFSLLVEDGDLGLTGQEFLKSLTVFQKCFGLLLGSSSSINFLKLVFFFILLILLALLEAFLY